LTASVAYRTTIIIAALILCIGCETESRDFRHQFYSFGTLVTIDFFGVSPQSNAAAISAIESRINELDANWYPWREGELQQINAAIAARRSIAVTATLAELLQRSIALERQSGGRFNPAIGQLTELWGFQDLTAPGTSPPDDLEIRKWLSLGTTSQDLEWDGVLLRSKSPSVMLDLGGIAKGAILEQFVNILGDAGIDNAIVDIGGDLAVVGQVKDRSARIGIRSPRSDDVLGWLEILDGESVMTSGDYERFFEYDGKRYQHVLDPRTGYPVEQTTSATVVHRDPVLADAAATALLVAGAAEFEEVCGLLGLDTALIVTASGDLRLTQAMEKRLNWPGP
jgi:thiamine biosynthesis lipoprotein